MGNNKSVFATLALISQLGISMVVPVLLCVWIGVKIDDKFGTSLTVWLIVVGVLAGARSVYALVKRTKEVMDHEEE